MSSHKDYELLPPYEQATPSLPEYHFAARKSSSTPSFNQQSNMEQASSRAPLSSEPASTSTTTTIVSSYMQRAWRTWKDSTGCNKLGHTVTFVVCLALLGTLVYLLHLDWTTSSIRAWHMTISILSTLGCFAASSCIDAITTPTAAAGVVMKVVLSLLIAFIGATRLED